MFSFEGSDMEEVVWSIGAVAAGWLKEALAAARNKEQARFARVIEHAGTVTSGLRALDREAHRLFLPIVYGDVRTWPTGGRERWAEDITNLAYENKVTPAMRISVNALVELLPQQPDRDVAKLLELLLFPVREEGRALISSSLLLNLVGHYDINLSDHLNAIVAALRDPDSWHADLQRDVRPFIFPRQAVVGWEIISLYSESSFTDMNDDMLVGFFKDVNIYTGGLTRYADAAEGIFGRLLALQHRIFPQLPTPVWVWQPG